MCDIAVCRKQVPLVAPEVVPNGRPTTCVEPLFPGRIGSHRNNGGQDPGGPLKEDEQHGKPPFRRYPYDGVCHQVKGKVQEDAKGSRVTVTSGQKPIGQIE